MELKKEIELENTKLKLRQLEDHYARRSSEAAENTHLKQLSLRSIKQTINQLTEEIVRYEAKQSTRKAVVP